MLSEVVGRDEDDGWRHAVSSELVLDLEPAAVGQLHIEHHHVETAALKGLEGDRDATVDRITFGDAPALPKPQDLQLGLFAPSAPNPVLEELAELDVDGMTPVEALNKLSELRARARRG